MPKCYYCKKELNKNDAYMWEHVVEKSGKIYKRYCCSLEEKEQVERDKELYKLCQYETDAILNRPITNNVRNKELAELHEQYSWEEIYRCIKANARHISDMIRQNHIEGDYAQIRYMMQVIKNTIYDFTREDKRKNSFEQYAQANKEEIIEEDEDEEILNKLKSKKKDNGNSISDFLNNLGK